MKKRPFRKGFIIPDRHILLDPIKTVEEVINGQKVMVTTYPPGYALGYSAQSAIVRASNRALGLSALDL